MDKKHISPNVENVNLFPLWYWRFFKTKLKPIWQVCLDACRDATCDRHVSLMWTLSLLCQRCSAGYTVCLCECVFVHPVHLLLKREGGWGSLGSSSPSKKWQRRQLNLCSVPPSLHPPSLTTPLLYWQVWGQSLMNLNDPTSFGIHSVHGTNVQAEYEWMSLTIWNTQTHTHKSVNSKHLGELPCFTVSLRENMEIHAQWSSWIISWSWMSTLRPHTHTHTHVLVHDMSKDQASLSRSYAYKWYVFAGLVNHPKIEVKVHQTLASSWCYTWCHHLLHIFQSDWLYPDTLL